MKNKELIIIGSIIVVLAVGLTVLEAMKPKPIDWTPNYSAREKTPLGLYVLDKEAPQLFKGDSIHKFWQSPYEFFDPKYSYNTSSYAIKGTFLEISDGNEIDPESVKELMHFVNHGNTVMLSMRSFPYILLDTLGVTMDYQKILIDSVQVNLADDPRDRYWIREGAGLAYFDSIPQNDSITILGSQRYKSDDLPNFIEARFGYGRFLLHAQPAAFSNYYLLKDDYYNYAQKVLSKIPKGTIYWRNDAANTRLFEDEGSSLRYIMSQPGLKWAWRLGIWGLVLFILFNGRRRQRVVPILSPVRNTTVDFAKTIGNLYYQEGDHHTIIEKKVIYFLEHIRNEYLIDTSILDDAFVEKLHFKTGKPVEDIQYAVYMIKKYRHNFVSSANDVVAINNAIEKLRL